VWGVRLASRDAKLTTLPLTEPGVKNSLVAMQCNPHASWAEVYDTAYAQALESVKLFKDTAMDLRARMLRQSQTCVLHDLYGLNNAPIRLTVDDLI
jgi:hypothetical protein